jgi:hypothetical protein
MIWVTRYSRRKRESYQIPATVAGFILPRVAAPGPVLLRGAAELDPESLPPDLVLKRCAGVGRSRVGQWCWVAACRATVLGGIEQGGGATARRSNFQRSNHWRCSDFQQSNPSGPWSRPLAAQKWEPRVKQQPNWSSPRANRMTNCTNRSISRTTR